MKKAILWTIDKKYSVSFHDLSENSYDIENYYIYKSSITKETIGFKELNNNELGNAIINRPSTNGVYNVLGQYHPNGKSEDKKDVTILLSTEAFLTTYLEDKMMNTTTANAKYFFKGRNISPKLFIKKHLIKAKIPSRYNDVDPSHETLYDILGKDMEYLSVVELKEILRSQGYKISGNKADLIYKMVDIIKAGL